MVPNPPVWPQKPPTIPYSDRLIFSSSILLVIHRSCPLNGLRPFISGKVLFNCSSDPPGFFSVCEPPLIISYTFFFCGLTGIPELFFFFFFWRTSFSWSSFPRSPPPGWPNYQRFMISTPAKPIGLCYPHPPRGGNYCRSGPSLWGACVWALWSARFSNHPHTHAGLLIRGCPPKYP